MPQSEMEALLQLQKETIESLRQLVESQRLTIEQMAKSHEEQTAQLNQTIANLNETVEYLKKKLFSSSSEKTKKDEFPGQMNLFNEAEAAADPSAPEPTLKEAVSGYNRQPGKPDEVNELSVDMKESVPKAKWFQTHFLNHTAESSFFQVYIFPICSLIARIFRTVEFRVIVPCRASAYLWTSFCFWVYRFLCGSSIIPSVPVASIAIADSSRSRR